jgi:hypothetical protein
MDHTSGKLRQIVIKMVKSAEMCLQRSLAVSRPTLQGTKKVYVLVFTRENIIYIMQENLILESY